MSYGDLMSTKIRNRIMLAGEKFLSNNNIAKHIHSEEELKALQDEVAKNMGEVLRSLVIDTEHDHNTKETAERVAKMFIREIFNGRYTEGPKITAFPNVDNAYDQLYVTGPITVRSTCAH